VLTSLNRKDLLFVFSIFVFYLFVKGLGGSLWPFAIALIASYIALPWVQKLEKLGVPRMLGTALFLLVFLSIGALIAVLIVPYLWSQSTQLLKDAPGLFWSLLSRIDPWLNRMGIESSEILANAQSWVLNAGQEVQAQIARRLTWLLSFGVGNIFRFVILWLQILMAPVFFFFILGDLEKLKGFFVEWIPEDFRGDVLHFVTRANFIMGSFFRGQILLAMTLAFFYSVTLWMLGIPYGFLIGFLSGILSFIPYVGFSLGLVTTLAISLANGSAYWTAGSAVIYITGQVLDGVVLSPKLVGRAVGLPPLASVLAAIIGGNLLGFPGVLLGIPLVAITRELWFMLRTKTV
jgi:predicted PurR-regulated permease PerM